MSFQTPEPLATSCEVAEAIKIPEATLAVWRHRQQGPAYIRVGRHIRYRWSDITAWLDEQAVPRGA